MSGPEFLQLYWIALAVSLVFAIAARVRPRWTRGSVPAGVLDRYDLAFLTGGPRRVVETAVAALIGSGALRSARDGAVRVVGSPRSDNPVERAVLADAARYRHRTLALLFTAVSEHDAPRAVGDRLVRRGYLVAPSTAGRWLRRGVLPMALLLLVGLVRWVNGLVIGAPVGWLTLQLALTGVLIPVLVKAPASTRTALGARAVAQARAAGPTATSGVLGLEGDAGVVALDGFRAHPNIPLRAAARGPARTRRPVGHNGSTAFLAAGSTMSSCGSGSSSCGGGSGSSCGGGGGCGGGGA
ncbi:TIGR04222 domain-containing membrane protein [Saccharothrix australiensis]|uniref:TIGR04222 domain-containing membrane protein n=1 Tax=Saccharothrix australiensis TaxID=2072 RepID=UPI0014776701|nr:TIGR04222 domain-containing membrane protein [Saccharothrix australiensis]